MIPRKGKQVFSCKILTFYSSMYPNIPTALSTQTAACGPSQSTPLLTSRALIDNQPDVSDISCSDVNEQ